MRQRDLLADRVDEIETRIARCCRQGRCRYRNRFDSATGTGSCRVGRKQRPLAKAAGPIEVRPEDQFQRLNEEYNKRIKELQKAGDLGDFAKIDKLSGELKGLQEQLQKAKDTGPDLFAVEKTAVEKEAVAKSKSEAETNAALAQGQQDLLAQIGKPETRIDARQRQVLDRYQDSVRQLDEAYAANADKRIIDQLVDKVQADAAERAAIIAKISDTRTLAQEEAGQQRIARITRAIAEAEAKQDTGSVAGLRNQLAKAIVDTSRPQVENRRSKALEDQMEAAEQVRSAIEDLRSKRYLGEGTKDPSMAASLKSGIERQANEAVGRYVEAAIRDVQALREQNGQKKMTVTEATRMAMDIRGHLEKAVKNRNKAAFAIPKGDLALDRTRKIGESPERKSQPTLVQRGAVSPIERQLAQIKKKYHKGDPLKSKIEVDLKQEPDLLRKRQLEQGEVLNEALADAESRRERTTRELAIADAAVAREKAAGTQPEQLPPNYYEAYAEKLGLPPLEKVTTGRMTKNEFKQRLLKEDLTRINKEIKDLRKHIDSFSNADRVETIEKRIAAIKETEGVAGAGERLRLLEEKITALKGQVNPDRDVIAQLEKAVATERTLADKERVANETRERQGARSADESISTIRTERETRQAERQKEEQALRESKEEPLQKSLFGDKELEPIATVRATPENFQRLLNSNVVQKFKAKAAAMARPMSAMTAARKAKGSVTVNKENLRTSVAIQERFANEVKNAPTIIKKLEKEIVESRELAKNAKEALDNKTSALADWPADFGAVQEYALSSLRKSYERLLKNVTEKEEVLAQFKRDHAEHLETSVSVERAILKELKRNLEKTVEGSPEQRRVKAQADASRAREAVLERNIKEMAEERNAAERKAETARAERLSELPVTKQEIVETPFKLPGSEERVLRKQITRETVTAQEKRETLLEKQKAARDEIAQRKEPALQRQKLAEALKQESELKKQLKALQAEQGKLFGKKEAIEKRLEKARSETVIDRLKQELKDTKAEIKKADFANREKSLKSQLEELSKVGAKVERVLEVAGDKPPRKQATKPLRVGKTAAEKYNIKELFKEGLEEYSISGPYAAQYKGRSGINNRVAAPHTGERLDPAASKRTAESIEKNIPKDVKVSSVESFADLPDSVKKQMARDGITEGSPQAAAVRGFVTPDGEVYVIRGNHGSLKELERTYVHEIIGHAGVDRVLGKAGMEALVKRIQAQGGALELARKLGVEDQVKGALNDYALGIQKLKDSKASKADIDSATRDMETQAVRELLAYTAEKRVDETFKQKAGRWFRRLLARYVNWLRKHGFAELSKATTSDIYNLISKSQRNYNKGELGAMRDMNGNISYRIKPVFNPSIDPAEAATVGKVIARNKVGQGQDQRQRAGHELYAPVCGSFCRSGLHRAQHARQA
jgi:hypothetical protein